MSYRALIVVLFCSCVVAIAAAEVPLGTAFTYQGQVTHGGVPINGPTKLTFKLYDAVTGGALQGTQTLTGVPVSNGIFTVQLNGGGELGANALNGSRRWRGGRTSSGTEPINPDSVGYQPPSGTDRVPVSDVSLRLR